ncbi:MAG: hypothetical protein ACI4YB_10955 [Oscillospiraceae bacterium]
MKDEKEYLWDIFTGSGSIADYLRYKGIYGCGDSAEYGYSGISAEEPRFCSREADTVISRQK